MPAPELGTAVYVATVVNNYRITIPGIVVMTLAHWTREAEQDMPVPLDEDRAHIVLTGMMEGNPVRLFLPNAQDQLMR